MYDEGKGVAQNYQEALKWYRLAADQGNTIAQHNLGWSYYDGQGVSKNIEMAYYWWLIASANADAEDYGDFSENRDLAASELVDSVCIRIQNEARLWIEQRESEN